MEISVCKFQAPLAISQCHSERSEESRINFGVVLPNGNTPEMFRSAQHDSAIYEMSASTKPISHRDVFPQVWRLEFVWAVGAWTLEIQLAQALLGILLQPIPETIEFFSDLRLDSSELR